MNDENQEKPPETLPAYAKIPPIPPKKTARDLEDDGSPYSFVVSVTEERVGADRSTSIHPIVDFTFDSWRFEMKSKSLILPGIPLLQIIADYRHDDGISVTVVGEAGRGFGLLRIRKPLTEAHASYWISPETIVVIRIFRKQKE